MADIKKSRERRKYARFRAKPGALVVFSNKNKQPGRIIDISKGGLAFCYVDGRDKLEESAELEIFFGEDNFCLDSLPFETVFDCVLVEGAPNTPKNINLRSVKFGKLTPKQQYQLAYFIEANTKAEDSEYAE